MISAPWVFTVVDADAPWPDLPPQPPAQQPDEVDPEQLADASSLEHADLPAQMPADITAAVEEMDDATGDPPRYVRPQDCACRHSG